MLPLSFDRRVLSSLPPMDAGLEGRVLTVLRAIVQRRVLPQLAALDEIDAVQLARAAERHRLARFEDPAGEVELVSFVSADGGGFTIWLHERIFDYIAFGLPANPLQAFEPPTSEAAKVMALAELVLRHQLDHVARPGRAEAEVLAADRAFVRDRREREPGFHAHLMAALADPTNGLRATAFSALLAHDGADEGFDAAAEAAVAAHIPLLAGLPVELLAGVFMTLALTDRERLLSACYELGNDRELTVARRARHLVAVLALCERQLRSDPKELRALYDALTAGGRRDGVLRELEVNVHGLDPGDEEGAFAAFLSRLGAVPVPAATGPTRPPQARLAPALEGPHLATEYPKPGSLKERIETARVDPRVPRSVVRAIDNNAANIDSHSSAKYTEFIETLLAVPWGHLTPLEVGPREFAAGLEAGHFGLAGPKELIADFFANLIWRYRDFDPERAGRLLDEAGLVTGPDGLRRGPDGQPVRWALNRLAGAHLTDRVYGPTLTLRVLQAASDERLGVFLYGSTPATLKARCKADVPLFTDTGKDESTSLPNFSSNSLTGTIAL